MIKYDYYYYHDCFTPRGGQPQQDQQKQRDEVVGVVQQGVGSPPAVAGRRTAGLAARGFFSAGVFSACV